MEGAVKKVTLVVSTRRKLQRSMPCTTCYITCNIKKISLVSPTSCRAPCPIYIYIYNIYMYIYIYEYITQSKCNDPVMPCMTCYTFTCLIYVCVCVRVQKNLSVSLSLRARAHTHTRTHAHTHTHVCLTHTSELKHAATLTLTKPHVSRTHQN